MNIELTRPICFFDLETTGVNTAKDRIVEMSIIRVEPDGTETVKTWRVNPEMPIPLEASKVHGIYDDDVKDEPTFKEISQEVFEMIHDADLAGFNSNRFDVPLLAEELLRAGLDFDLKTNNLIDIQNIFHKMEPRNLSAAYRFYCNGDLSNAHSAEADTRATYEIFKAQIKKYEDLPKDMGALSRFSAYFKAADFQGRIIYNDKNEEIINFGKYKGQKVTDVLQKDKGYFGWIMRADFPLYTKKVIKNVYERMQLQEEQEKLDALKNKFQSE
jgi:DNA polymerase-3 subunit epsilon